MKRFESTPAKLLDTERDAPIEYHDQTTVAKTFALAISEAAKLHSAAKELITYAALLAPEPIPLYLFSEFREKFGEPLASLLRDDGLDNAIAALLSFALIDRERIFDERDPSIGVDAIRVHRLVRHVAAAQEQDFLDLRYSILLRVLADAYPDNVVEWPNTWPRARQLDRLTLAVVDVEVVPQLPEWGGAGRWRRFLRHVRSLRWLSKQAARIAEFHERAMGRSVNASIEFIRQTQHIASAVREAELDKARLLWLLGLYRYFVLADYDQAFRMFERMLAIRERQLGPEHQDTGVALHSLGLALVERGELAKAKQLMQRAIKIFDKILGPNNTESATNMASLAIIFQREGDLAAARDLAERSSAIRQNAFATDSYLSALSFNNLAVVLRGEGKLSEARSLNERALAIIERERGPDDLETGAALASYAETLRVQGHLAEARHALERALKICRTILPSGHLDIARCHSALGDVQHEQADFEAAIENYLSAVRIAEKLLEPNHPFTTLVLNDLGKALSAKGDTAEARSYFERVLAIHEKTLGLKHIATASTLSDLGGVLFAGGDLVRARESAEQALAIYVANLGPDHSTTRTMAENVALVLDSLGNLDQAKALRESYGLAAPESEPQSE